MSLPIDEEMVSRFLALLEEPAPDGRQKEQVVQDFLEANTALIPTPDLENHGLHHNLVVSKFPISTVYTTDYVYLTKSSSKWIVRFVELEQPDKAIFTNDQKNPTFSAAFNGALGQVEQWMAHAKDHRQEIIDRLAPLISPLSGNVVHFQYELIIGRSADKNASAARKRLFEQKCENSQIRIFTYDALVSFYKNAPRYEKHILSLTKEHFRFKRMGANLDSIFAYLGPDVLNLSKAQIERLRDEGFHIDAWRKGTLLTFNGKWEPDDPQASVRAMLDRALLGANGKAVDADPASPASGRSGRPDAL